MTRILSTAVLVAALTAGSASAGPLTTWGGKSLISTKGGPAVISVAKGWHLAAWGVVALAGGYVAFNSIRLLNGASGG